MHTVILLLVLFLDDGSVKSASTPIANYDECQTHATELITTLKANDTPQSNVSAGWAVCVPADVSTTTS